MYQKCPVNVELRGCCFSAVTTVETTTMGRMCPTTFNEAFLEAGQTDYSVQVRARHRRTCIFIVKLLCMHAH